MREPRGYKRRPELWDDFKVPDDPGIRDPPAPVRWLFEAIWLAISAIVGAVIALAGVYMVVPDWIWPYYPTRGARHEILLSLDTPEGIAVAIGVAVAGAAVGVFCGWRLVRQSTKP